MFRTRALSRLIDFALPPRCPGCGAIVVENGHFCAQCWGALRFLGPPWCAACNMPFETEQNEGALCGACLADRPVLDGVRAAVAYGDVARTVALRLKYGGRMGHAGPMAAAMVRHMPPDADAVVPVPLHRGRLWKRGYNQALLIAAALSRRSGVRLERDALRRVRATPPLRGRNARERADAVARAFAVAPGARERIAGRVLVLVDDVHASGATATACARVLKRAGAARVVLLCWARVVADGADGDGAGEPLAPGMTAGNDRHSRLTSTGTHHN